MQYAKHVSDDSSSPYPKLRDKTKPIKWPIDQFIDQPHMQSEFHRQATAQNYLEKAHILMAWRHRRPFWIRKKSTIFLSSVRKPNNTPSNKKRIRWKSRQANTNREETWKGKTEMARSSLNDALVKGKGIYDTQVYGLYHSNEKNLCALKF